MDDEVVKTAMVAGIVTVAPTVVSTVAGFSVTTGVIGAAAGSAAVVTAAPIVLGGAAVYGLYRLFSK